MAMKRHLLAAFLVPLIPLLARAQEAPERLLPANAQIYVRWDGIDKHKAAFEKTALNNIFQGDLGELLTGLIGDKKEHHLFKFAQALGKQGLVVGVETRGAQPPEAQLVA